MLLVRRLAAQLRAAHPESRSLRRPLHPCVRGLLLLGLVAQFAAVPAWGQTGEEDPEAAEPGYDFEDELTGASKLPTQGIEEITVTGEVLESTTQADPDAITTFDQEELDTLGVVSVDTLALNTPSLHVGQVGNTAVITLRGIGLENLTSVGEAGVGFQVDGVHQGRPAASNATFFDLERVDVLRGPQGYEGGRNLTAGKIALWSKKPQEEREAFADFEAGNYDLIKTRGVVNYPFFEDKLMTRFSAIYESRTGYQDNVFWSRPFDMSPWENTVDGIPPTGDDANGDDADSLALRGQIRSLFLDQQAEFRIIGNYSWSRGAGPALHLIGDPPSQINGPAQGVIIGGLEPQFFGEPDPVTGQPRSFTCPDAPPTAFAAATCAPGDPRETFADVPYSRDNRSNGITTLFTWDSPYLAETPLSDVSFNVVAGWQQNIEDSTTDLDGTNIPDQRLDLRRDAKQTQFEAFVERPDVGSWDFKFGFFYFEEDIDTQVCLDSLGTAAFLDLAIDGDTDTTSYAGYGRIGFRPFDNLRAYGAVRYTKETKSATQINEGFTTFQTQDRAQIISGAKTLADFPLSTDGATQAAQDGCGRYFRDIRGLPKNYIVTNPDRPDFGQINPNGIIGAPILGSSNLAETSDTFSAWTPSFGLTWSVTETSTLGFSATRGFKAGGFPLGADDQLTPKLQEPYPSEFVWSYEISSKNDLFDGLMRLNVNLFWTEYEPFQICQFSGAIFFCRADGSSTIRGVEVEWLANPIDGLQLNGFFNFLDSRINDFQIVDPTTRVPAPGGGPPVSPPVLLPTDVAGNQLPKAPSWAGSFGIQYAIDLGRGGFLIPRFQTQFQGRTYFRVFNKQEFSQDPFVKMDVKLTWRSEDDRFFVEGYVQNVTDVDVINSMIVGPREFGGQVLGQYQAPRLFGARLGINYISDWVDRFF